MPLGLFVTKNGTKSFYAISVVLCWMVLEAPGGPMIFYHIPCL